MDVNVKNLNQHIPGGGPGPAFEVFWCSPWPRTKLEWFRAARAIWRYHGLDFMGFYRAFHGDFTGINIQQDVEKPYDFLRIMVYNWWVFCIYVSLQGGYR